MQQTIIEVLMPPILQIVIIVFGSIATFLVREGFNFIKNKNQYAIAKQIYFIIEQIYKGYSSEEKRSYFDAYIAKKLPNMKIEDVDDLRESIVGEINVQMKMKEKELQEK